LSTESQNIFSWPGEQKNFGGQAMEVIKTDCGLCINCCGVNAYVEDGKLVKVEGMPEQG
jgi:anaerobic selenocysteine-containing dehydrogenase